MTPFLRLGDPAVLRELPLHLAVAHMQRECGNFPEGSAIHRAIRGDRKMSAIGLIVSHEPLLLRGPVNGVSMPVSNCGRVGISEPATVPPGKNAVLTTKK